MRIEFDYTQDGILNGNADFHPREEQIRKEAMESDFLLEDLVIVKDGDLWKFTARTTPTPGAQA